MTAFDKPKPISNEIAALNKLGATIFIYVFWNRESRQSLMLFALPLRLPNLGPQRTLYESELQASLHAKKT